MMGCPQPPPLVSTHSRPKAAGHPRRHQTSRHTRFNTQPPEGGWFFGVHNGKVIRSFNTQPPEGGWGSFAAAISNRARFQHTAARRRLGQLRKVKRPQLEFQHTAARRRLEAVFFIFGSFINVSTHSRPKAAGGFFIAIRPSELGFNTQPPEGGWVYPLVCKVELIGFQHTAARRRLGQIQYRCRRLFRVSTHSRPKAAGVDCQRLRANYFVSTHSRPKAAGLDGFCITGKKMVSTHSRPKAAGARHLVKKLPADVSTHSRPKAAGSSIRDSIQLFHVSTHSRPKAAGSVTARIMGRGACFNTQPPEGGWFSETAVLKWANWVSTHSRPKAAGCAINLPKLF